MASVYICLYDSDSFYNFYLNGKKWRISKSAFQDFEGRLEESLIATKTAQMKTGIFLNLPMTEKLLSQTTDDPRSLNTGADIPFLSKVVCLIVLWDFWFQS